MNILDDMGWVNVQDFFFIFNLYLIQYISFIIRLPSTFSSLAEKELRRPQWQVVATSQSLLLFLQAAEDTGCSLRETFTHSLFSAWICPLSEASET